MRTAGIIMECNPFHEGHQYIIGKAAQIAGEGGHVVVVMSGNFAQRGIPAVAAKEIRTAQILNAGADLVLELPVRYAVSGAGYFAEGGIGLLRQTGVVTDLVFGSECGNLETLSRCARFLLKEPEEYQRLLREYLAEGLSYPAARSAAAAACSENVKLPSEANDLLGVEYLKALQCYGAEADNVSIVPHAIPKIPAESASARRDRLRRTGEGVFADDFSGLLLEKLLMIDSAVCRYDYVDYADVSGDLANRIHHLLPQYVSWTQFCGLLKRRNLTWTGISRALTHILLDITRDMMPPRHTGHSLSCDAPAESGLASPYARVLGCRRAALPLLGRIRDNGLILISSRADADRALARGTRERQMLDCDLRASQVWELAARMKSEGRNMTTGTPETDVPALSEFSKPLIIL